MNEPAAVRPLAEAAELIRRLRDHESQDQLASAIREVGEAIEQSLRTRLRDDPAAPERHRMSAFSPQELSLDEVVRSLRARDRISIEAAGAIHDARAAMERAATGTVQPRDAESVRAAADRLRVELSREPDAPADGAEAPLPSGPGPAVAGSEAESGGTAPPTESKEARWMRWIAAAVAAVFLLGLAWVTLRGGNEEYDAALMAFRAGRMDSASAGFERVLEDRPEDVTTMLYLARSYRRLAQPTEAAEVLREAVEQAPEDADVRRELGHLFMDLGRPVSGIAQYERALEYDAAEPLNWAALIGALRQMGDPRAEQLLRQAPPEVQAALGGS